MHISSKLPQVGTSIFAVMSGLATRVQAINLSQGFPNFDPSPRLQQLVYEAMQKGCNQYAPMPGLLTLRTQIAEKINRMYGVSIDPETEITVTSGATQALFCAIAAFVGLGDEVILLEPCYDSYKPSIQTVGGVPIAYKLKPPEYAVDFDHLKSLITPRTRMIIMNTPNNPTGIAWSHEDMVALENLLAGTDIVLISDEVYEHLIFDGRIHHTALKYPSLRERTIAVYSFGKTFHNTGWKMGYVVAPPPLTVEFRKIHQFNVFSANHPIQEALSIFLQNPEEYQGLGDFYQNKRDFFLQSMAKTRFKPLHCQGTYFQLFDYSDISDEDDFAFSQRLTTEFGVAVIPVSSFYGDGTDHKVIRMCFAKTEDLLAQAGERLERV